MSEFQELQARHQKLIEREQRKESILDEVQRYIEDARRGGGAISTPLEREQIRANLRYWAGFVFEHSEPHIYPTTELAPYAGPLTPSQLPPWAIPAVLVVAAALVVALTLAIVRGINISTSATAVSQLTQNALVQTQAVLTAHPATNTPLPTATFTPTSTATLTPTSEPSTPVLTSTSENQGILAQLTSPSDGQEVTPRTKLSGTFSNLQPGWSIHVLIQPLSKGGRYFPMSDFFTVPSGAPSGEWSLDVTLGQGAELDQPEQYNISLGVVIDEDTRAALASASATGLDKLPESVIPFPQVTTVRRGAYRAIKEIRILFSRFIQEQGNIELVTVRPDGSDAQQITFTPDMDELLPGLSPSGLQIAFVGRRQDASGTSLQSLWIMDSDGQNRTLVIEQPNVVFERPVWSPDGRYIAYGADPPDDEGKRFTNLFMYDTVTRETTALTQGSPPRRFPSWLVGAQALVYSGLSIPTGTSGLFRIDISNLERSTLFDTPAEETQPFVSPDGSRIVYVGFPENSAESNREIYVLDLATGTTKQTTDNPALDWYPQWGPDGKTIYFVSFRQTGKAAIWATNLDGTNLRKIVSDISFNGYWVGLMDAFLPVLTSPSP